MTLPRDLSGDRLVTLLRRYGYEVSRQTSSQIRLTSTRMGTEHHITVPDHKALRVGTLNTILTDLASYLQTEKAALLGDLFG